ncbi:MAG TPA: peptidoglycan DD-metalloendopeptidase family protein [Gaiellaceae bacterium]
MARRLAIVLAAVLVFAAPAAGDNSGKISQLHQRIAAARAKEARLSAQITDITSAIRKLEARVGDVSQRLSVLERDLDLHRRRLEHLTELFALQSDRLAFLRREYARVVRELNVRMVDIYETRDPTLLDVILESNSLQDALDRIHYLEAIAQQDKHISKSVGAARDRLHDARERTKRVRARVRSETQVIAVRTQQQRIARIELLASQRGLAGKRARQRNALGSTREQKAVMIAEANALAAEDARIRAQLAAAQSARASSAATDATPSSHGLIWPVSGPVTSPFGYRWGRLHAGIDIGVGYGTPIHAAASGTVVLAGWTGGYGNYTCIDHGGGLATCYAHQSSYAVSAGAHVSQGQVIGYVGSTGHSFGAHLHFEVRINGTPVDPLGYL